ncbi:unnamed protein product [Cylicostephanus goldi]|uniref:Major facilitator superfamily associated domain-containing protein n=1 Tax=Cylicostephanus goldi TaxID=71465 RepID=A0A3P7PZI6_CYLGO|nr:unnamed protein product [Cylicostephanus goldi]
MIAGSLRPSLPFSAEKGSLLADVDDFTAPARGKEMTSMWDATKEILLEKDFMAIIGSNFIHTARSVSHMNFASIATELLIPQTILPKGSIQLSLFYGVLTLGPQILLILNERLINKCGAYRILMTTYAISFFSGLIFFFASDPYFIMIFMVIDSITVHSAAPLFNIIISDFIDDDAKRHSRKSGLSSLVFSLNALVVKPAQSIAPVVVVYILNAYGYQNFVDTKQPSADLAHGIRLVLMSTPLILGGLQYLIFKSYSLKNRHLQKPEENI